jgi:regulator of replication initiation timing
MRIFKRLRGVEEQIQNLFERLGKMAGNIVAILKTLNAMNEELGKLHDENINLRKRLKDIEDKLPDYEDAINKGVERRWDDAVQAVADFNPYVELNKPEVNK